jgi:hypothetical protein
MGIKKVVAKLAFSNGIWRDNELFKIALIIVKVVLFL